MATTTSSNLILNNRQDLKLTGIKKVKSTDPRIIIAHIDNGAILISGINLSVEHLDIKAETLEISGVINNIKYTSQVSKNFSFKNMFK